MQQIRTKALAFTIAFLLAAAAMFALPRAAYADSSAGAAAGDGTALSAADTAPASASYSVHARGGSWKALVKDGADSAAAKGIDGLKLKVASSMSGSVQYQVYVAGYGWQAAKSAGKVAGKLGKKYGVEAVRVALTGELSTYYDIVYDVAQKQGSWLGEKKNGSTAGVPGSGKPLVGFKVRLVKKASVSSRAEGIVGVRYHVRMQDKKWQVWKSENATAGKLAKAARLRSFAVALDRGSSSGDIRYRVRVGGGKWKAWKKNGVATGSYSNVEAIQIKLTGNLAQKYDVVYRVNVVGVGWQKRVRNGEVAGVTNRGVFVRAIRVQLVPKSKRTGWVGSDESWEYYKNGKAVKSQWVVSKESPIDEMQGSSDSAQRYWIDATGKLALDRIVNPSSSLDAGAGFQAYAMRFGYIMTNETRMIGKTWYTADKNGVLKKTTSKKTILIERYVKWAVDIANDSSHGYSQCYRWGPDYDCSSLVVSALSNTGFRVGDAVWTGNMRSELTKYGFKWYTDLTKLKRGDILLVHNSSRQHTEIYLGGGKTVGAHIAETGGVHGVSGDQTGKEISVGPYYSIWEGFLRYVG